MNRTAILALSLLVTACGGGGGDADEPLLAGDVCEAASVADANSFIVEGADCKAWAVGGALVDGAPFPDFIIGGV